MRKALEFVAFNVWLFAVTAASAGVFALTYAGVTAIGLPETIERVVAVVVCVPASLGSWYYVAKGSMRLFGIRN